MRQYTALIYFVATFHVQCELCGHPFAFEQEFCGGGRSTISQSATDKAQTSATEQAEQLQSGDYSSVEPQKCPQCGYLQSWMVQAAKRNKYISHFAGWGALAVMGLCLGLLGLGQQLSDRDPPPVFLLWILLLAAVVGAVGLVLSIRRYRQFDPNTEVLQGRPAPTGTRSPQVSFRPGRKAY